ncbi:hypothetical protein SynA1560_01823 [Synechococcus sp. A15-60]|nr:hypothetical protein SynA1560_01823 [Synechococcus sp. A15-60]
MEAEDSCEDAPSKFCSDWLVATPPTCHIFEAGYSQQNEIPAANSDQRRFLQGLESLLHEAQL